MRREDALTIGADGDAAQLYISMSRDATADGLHVQDGGISAGVEDLRFYSAQA